MIEMKCCDILGTRILVTNMADTVERIEHDMEELRGKYICVGNVHTTVMAHDDAHYHEVQKSAAFVLPDGKPLSVYSRKHGFPEGGARDRSGSDAGTVRKRERIKALFLRRIAGDIADVRAKA